MQLSNSVCYLIKTRRNKINCSFNKRMKTKQKSILYNTGTSFFVCLVAMEISYYLHTWITKLEVRHLQHCSSPDGKFTAAMRSEQKLSSQGDCASVAATVQWLLCLFLGNTNISKGICLEVEYACESWSGERIDSRDCYRDPWTWFVTISPPISVTWSPSDWVHRMCYRNVLTDFLLPWQISQCLFNNSCLEKDWMIG